MQTETVEKPDYSRPFWRRQKIQVLAWCGIEIKDKDGFHDIDQSLIVLRPELVVRDLKIVDLANDINLHSEIEPGECCCGLKLEYAGMPPEAQIGHTFRDEPTSVIMLDSASGIKQHCQTCNSDFAAFTTECKHATTREPVYCHNCFQDHIAAVREHGCDGHNFADPAFEDAQTSKLNIFQQLLIKSNPGWWIYLIVAWLPVLLRQLGVHKMIPSVWPLISRSWFDMGMLGLVLWLYAIYRDNEPARSARIKERAIGVFIWAGYGLVLPGVIDELFVIIDWVTSGFGIA